MLREDWEGESHKHGVFLLPIITLPDLFDQFLTCSQHMPTSTNDQRTHLNMDDGFNNDDDADSTNMIHIRR